MRTFTSRTFVLFLYTLIMGNSAMAEGLFNPLPSKVQSEVEEKFFHEVTIDCFCKGAKETIQLASLPFDKDGDPRQAHENVDSTDQRNGYGIKCDYDAKFRQAKANKFILCSGKDQTYDWNGDGNAIHLKKSCDDRCKFVLMNRNRVNEAYTAMHEKPPFPLIGSFKGAELAEKQAKEGTTAEQAAEARDKAINSKVKRTDIPCTSDQPFQLDSKLSLEGLYPAFYAGRSVEINRNIGVIGSLPEEQEIVAYEYKVTPGGDATCAQIPTGWDEGDNFSGNTAPSAGQQGIDGTKTEDLPEYALQYRHPEVFDFKTNTTEKVLQKKKFPYLFRLIASVPAFFQTDPSEDLSIPPGLGLWTHIAFVPSSQKDLVVGTENSALTPSPTALTLEEIKAKNYELVVKCGMSALVPDPAAYEQRVELRVTDGQGKVVYEKTRLPWNTSIPWSKLNLKKDNSYSVEGTCIGFYKNYSGGEGSTEYGDRIDKETDEGKGAAWFKTTTPAIVAQLVRADNRGNSIVSGESIELGSYCTSMANAFLNVKDLILHRLVETITGGTENKEKWYEVGNAKNEAKTEKKYTLDEVGTHTFQVECQETAEDAIAYSGEVKVEVTAKKKKKMVSTSINGKKISNDEKVKSDALGLVSTGYGPQELKQIDCKPTCSASFLEGTTVTLTASPGIATEFESWGGVCKDAKSNVCKITLDSSVPDSVDAPANYRPKKVSVTVTAATAMGTVSLDGAVCTGVCTKIVEVGSKVTFTATANKGYQVVGWNWIAECKSSGGSCTVEVPVAGLTTSPILMSTPAGAVVTTTISSGGLAAGTTLGTTNTLNMNQTGTLKTLGR